jgi:hypothetical protein
VVATGGFNRTSPVDWIQFTLSAPPSKTNFQRSLKLNGNGYAMAVYTSCNAAFGGCGSNSSQATTWATNYTYTQGIGCCSDNLAKSNTIIVKVFRTQLTTTCENYTITAKNTW